MTHIFPWRWRDVATLLAEQPSGTRFRVARHLAEHPNDGGLHVSLGVPVGQRADFRGAHLHVVDFGSHYEAILDDAPAPRSRVPADAAFGALLGLLLGRSREAALTGALLGAAVLRHARRS